MFHVFTCFSIQFCRLWWAHKSYNTMPSPLKSMEQPHRRRFLRGCDGRPVPARDMSCLLRRRCFLEGPNWGEILTQTHLVLQYRRRGQQLLPRQLLLLPRTKVVQLEHGCKMAIWYAFVGIYTHWLHKSTGSLWPQLGPPDTPQQPGCGWQVISQSLAAGLDINQPPQAFWMELKWW